MSDKRIKFLNTHVDNLTMEEAVEEARKLVRKGERSYVVTPNVDHIVKIEHDHLFREIYEGADLILTDGKPLIWMSRLLRTPIKEKISDLSFGGGGRGGEKSRRESDEKVQASEDCRGILAQLYF